MSLIVPPEYIGAAIDRGRAHLRQETDPVRRFELERLLYDASIRCVPTAVDKLWALGPAPTLREALHQQQRERENAAAAAYWTAEQE